MWTRPPVRHALYSCIVQCHFLSIIIRNCAMHPNTAVTLVNGHCCKFHPTLSSLRFKWGMHRIFKAMMALPSRQNRCNFIVRTMHIVLECGPCCLSPINVTLCYSTESANQDLLINKNTKHSYQSEIWITSWTAGISPSVTSSACWRHFCSSRWHTKHMTFWL